MDGLVGGHDLESLNGTEVVSLANQAAASSQDLPLRAEDLDLAPEAAHFVALFRGQAVLAPAAIARLVDAITAGGPVEELVERLEAERAWKAALVDEQRALIARGTQRTDDDLLARVRARAAELRRLLGVHVGRTRTLLTAMLAGPVTMTPIQDSGRRGYHFKGRLRLGGGLARVGLETSQPVVAPNGIRPRVSVTSRFRQVIQSLARPPRRGNPSRLKHAGYVASFGRGFGRRGSSNGLSPVRRTADTARHAGSVLVYADPAMNWRARIAIDPAVLAGKPVIRGTRLAAELIVGLLGQGWSEGDILRNYPGLTHDDIAACLQYASEVLQAEKVYPLTGD
jgi:uncharacterized protein (DUF433 family)